MMHDPITHTMARAAHVVITILMCLLLSCDAATDTAETTPAAVTVFAAASTTDALTEIASLFAEQTGIAVTCSFSSSSMLAKQIRAGAPADVFISANVQWMDELETGGLLRARSRRDLLGNALVVVAPRDAPFELKLDADQRLPDVVEGRIAIGDPAHVPAGLYAQQSLTTLRWWEELEPRIVAGVDVRAALVFVERGEASAGVVYRTDARVTDRVIVVTTLPEDSYDPIIYPAALTRDSPASAERFLEFLHSEAAAAVFREAGFDVLQ